MASPAQERILRHITIYAFIPSFPLLLAGAIKSSGVLAGFLILPLFLSAATGLTCLLKNAHSERIRGSTASALWDLGVGLLFLGLLTGFWATEKGRTYWYELDSLLVETYGSVGAILDMCIHFYLGIRHVIAAGLSNGPTLCARCSEPVAPGLTLNAGDSAKYSLLGGDSDECCGRQSSETAVENV